MSRLNPKIDPGSTTVVATIRNYEEIQDVLAELKQRADILKIDRSLMSEFEQYLAAAPLVPKVLDGGNQSTIRKAQESIQEFQARLDRVAAIHLGARKILKALDRLEILAKGALGSGGFVTEKTSKPSADQLLAISVPELVAYQSDWTHLSKMCQAVQDHLGSAKDSIRLQLKLEDNLHWAQREGA